MDKCALRLDFDRQLMRQFRSFAITADAGLLCCRELAATYCQPYRKPLSWPRTPQSDVSPVDHADCPRVAAIDAKDTRGELNDLIVGAAGNGSRDLGIVILPVPERRERLKDRGAVGNAAALSIPAGNTRRTLGQAIAATIVIAP